MGNNKEWHGFKGFENKMKVIIDDNDKLPTVYFDNLSHGDVFTGVIQITDDYDSIAACFIKLGRSLLNLYTLQMFPDINSDAQIYSFQPCEVIELKLRRR